MKRPSRFDTWGPIAAILVPLAVYHLVKGSPFDAAMTAPFGHFVVVSFASLLAAAFSVFVGAAGYAQRNVQVTFLSLSFMSLAFLFTLHGLATPGFLIPASQVPGISAQLSLAIASVWFFVSSLPSEFPLVAWLGRRLGLVVVLWLGLMLAVVAVGLARHDLWEALPTNSSPLLWIITSLSLALIAAATVRYGRAYVYSRMPLPRAITFGGAWMLVAQWIMVTSELWRLSWWIYHYLLVAAVLALLTGVYLQYARGGSLQESIRGILLVDPIKRLEVGLSPSVEALVLATEARDRYTAGHSYRVALTAVRIGQAMRLSARELRALAVGGLIHDVGKIEVPDSILNKPGRLTPEERAAIEQHPVTGYRICRHLGFMKEELDIIRHHHERWDGQGYPDRLKGDEIPLLARILAVADVYDALTSHRSYRLAWSHDEARRYIESEAGKAFDPRCVAAWVELSVDGPVVQPGETAPWSSQAPEVFSAS